MQDWTRSLLFPFALFTSLLLASWIFWASKDEALTFIALTLAITALFVQILVFIVQSEQDSKQEQRLDQLHSQTRSALGSIQRSTSGVEYMLHEQIREILNNLLSNINSRAEPIQVSLENLQFSKGRLLAEEADDLRELLESTQSFLADLPKIVESSYINQKVDAPTGMTVGSSAWLKHVIMEFYDRDLTQEQSMYGLIISNPLNSEETRVLKTIFEREHRERRLVTYPLWEDWENNGIPTQSLEAKGLIMGTESGTYFLTPTGRLAGRYLSENR